MCCHRRDQLGGPRYPITHLLPLNVFILRSDLCERSLVFSYLKSDYICTTTHTLCRVLIDEVKEYIVMVNVWRQWVKFVQGYIMSGQRYSAHNTQPWGRGETISDGSFKLTSQTFSPACFREDWYRVGNRASDLKWPPKRFPIGLVTMYRGRAVTLSKPI